MKAFCRSLVLMVTVLWSCGEKDYSPDSHLSVKEQDVVLQSLIRYLGKPPENVGEKEKFDAKYNAYYLDIASRHRFEQYYIDSEDTHYFLISRPAPSLYEKRVAVGGKMKFDSKSNLLEYEEVFRTWKMKEEELKAKGSFLFDLMVKSKDMSPYYRLSSTEEFIEFPDEHTYYDKAARSWKSK